MLNERSLSSARSVLRCPHAAVIVSGRTTVFLWSGQPPRLYGSSSVQEIGRGQGDEQGAETPGSRVRDADLFQKLTN